MKDLSNTHYNKKLKPLAGNMRQDMTKAEACLWKFVLSAGMMRGYIFNRQRPVLDYIADFMCKELKLIIEVDGFTHLFDEVIANDERRQRDLENAGFTVLRFSDREVLKEIEGVRREIEAWIDDRVSPPPAPSSGGHAS